MSTSAQKFYPSPSTVTYYIGDVLIDDIFRVDFQRKVSHQPIWGYDSRKYDFVAQGKEVVTGNIIINYRYPGYLRVAIENARLTSEITHVAVQQHFDNNISEVDDPAFLHSIDSMTLSQKAGVLSNKILKLSAATAHGVGSRNQALVDELKSTLRNNYGSEAEPDILDNLSSPLDDKLITPFDLKLRYGFQNVAGGYIRTIKDCILIGESQTISASAGVSNDMSSSAQPILEVYSFFAKEIVVSKR